MDFLGVLRVFDVFGLGGALVGGPRCGWRKSSRVLCLQYVSYVNLVLMDDFKRISKIALLLPPAITVEHPSPSPLSPPLPPPPPSPQYGTQFPLNLTAQWS